MLPEEGMRRWMFEAWEWLLSATGGIEAFRRRARLVTPSADDFPVGPATGHALAEAYFHCVREHAGVAGRLPFVLLPVDVSASEQRISVPPAQVDEALAVFYGMDTLSAPVLLIAQLATGVCQHWVQTLEIAPPGDQDATELAIDTAVIFLGFGTILANAASHGTPRGPGVVEQAYARGPVLRPPEIAYALGIFGWLQEVSDQAVLGGLSAYPAAYYRAAVHELRFRGTMLDRLRGIRVREAGPYR